MRPRCDSMLIVLIIVLASTAGAQDAGARKAPETGELSGKTAVNAQGASGTKAAASTLSSNARHSTEPPDFQVLVWYRRDDPLGTFKYAVYDARKGEYTTAVDAWVRNVEKNYPAYLVVVRGVNLKREPGETEQLKVGSVIKRELMVAAAMCGVFLSGGPPVSFGLMLGTSHVAVPRASIGSLNRPLGAVGFDRSYLNPLPTPFPVPVPYPRPHP